MINNNYYLIIAIINLRGVSTKLNKYTVSNFLSMVSTIFHQYPSCYTSQETRQPEA